MSHMKRFYSLSACLRHTMKKIHLVDKCLMLIMLLLLMQSTYSLFADSHASGESNPIDVIVRTSTASIFGYILSANFIRHSTDPLDIPAAPPSPQAVSGQASGPQASIGFSLPQEQPDPPPGMAAAKPDTEEQQATAAGCLQILVATGICVFCLLVLTVLRNITPLMTEITASSSVQATVTQFRDIVSGCVGFLIGCPTVPTSQKS